MVPDQVFGLPSSISGSCKSYNTAKIIGMSTLMMSLAIFENLDDIKLNV